MCLQKLSLRCNDFLFWCAVVHEEKAPETNGKVAICHKGKTISVDEAAVKAHLGHGDYMGTYK
jgi:hypothetical protein